MHCFPAGMTNLENFRKLIPTTQGNNQVDCKMQKSSHFKLKLHTYGTISCNLADSPNLWRLSCCPLDFDGTILKEQWVNAGQAATAPTPPTHQYLTFERSGIMILLIFTTIRCWQHYTDGKTCLFCDLHNRISPLYINKADKP